jgi:hypothetical protein
MIFEVCNIFSLTQVEVGTHTFHLSCGKMTVTLEDVKPILCLRIGGSCVTDVVDSDGWRQKVYEFCGHYPDDNEKTKKHK